MTEVKIKKQKTQKMCHKKKKNKFEDYKNCLEATQVKNTMNHPEKMKSTYKVLKKIIKNS